MIRNEENKLIIALDVETAQEARELVATLRDVAGMFKIGSQLFTAAGPDFVREVVKSGCRVFLDLKFHDIPNTVAAASCEAARLGVSIFNIHTAGGSHMMRRAAQAVKEVSEREGLQKPILIAVTALTSADAQMLSEIGVAEGPSEQVVRLARLAAVCGLDGVVASPQEVSLVRNAVGRDDFVLVTPGVRPSGTSAHDQKRVMTPAEAVRAGADYLVVGRAILDADDPRAAAQRILSEMQSAYETV